MPLVALTLALAAAVPSSSHQTSAPPASIVIGRVVDATSARPIPGAIVTLFGSAAVPVARPGQRGADARPRLMTNAAGQFVVRGLRKGSLFFVVTKSGYVDATHAQTRPQGSGQRIEVGEGQRITGVEVRMWKHAAIVGLVTDELGEPVVGARVQTYTRLFAAGRVRYVPGTAVSTDDRGMYRVPNLAPGDYEIAVVSTQISLPSGVVDTLRRGAPSTEQRAELSRALGAIGSVAAPAGTPFAMAAGTHMLNLTPGTATTTVREDGSLLVYPTMFYPGSPMPTPASVVSVRAGEERLGVDLPLQPVRASRVAGIILGGAGYADHVPMQLVPVTPQAGPLTDIETAATITDADGAFAFPAVPPGEYVLRAVRVPHPSIAPDPSTATPVVRSGAVTVTAHPPPASTPGVPPPIPADATLYVEAPLAVGDAGATGLTLAFRAGPRVSGRVEFDGMGERPDAVTLANVRITLDSADGTALPQGLGAATGRIDANGQFRTYGVPPGKYFIRVGGLSDWFLSAAIYEGRDVADEPLDLSKDDITDVVLTFTDRPSSIAGVVRSGQAADGDAVVLVFPTDRSAWEVTGIAPRRMRTTRATADGSFLFPALPAGDYFVAAVRETFGDWQDPSYLESIAASAERVRVVEGERRVMNLRTIRDR